ncbi:MAG: delta-aminolevulinic acid dehydratase [Gammaproteobacteria bacterium RIFCSPLOWO2_02_FULL_42_14]|nr:MAG: delta-aminolevulinic acid dehydratase [Gammaproteobacteria bacterium RIFCSPHIGHO2_02_FULL_42_43]OGT27285.1 MAG: delta-aminolevulinic acid dehydratase [Gammaproteobacteria bacterium RIFCSPHIGHO2_01_FULL_42_8]OGT52959.1 MAG: delta-aminolevulinic acid dehydratase [Gammaproteobacteria bacterium RIFCSPHIGHO2_12_FULL_41_25]OGT61267.1 MAG: delta-aminolevulinic acid dehydratase [Gammaproteobacteria bacterium RIFCSPLOWO2_02_FULL_42_14]OGT87196.1 MAG: delta-aminolevulinic acid dehydratase [Gammap
MNHNYSFPVVRLRRLRKTPALRQLAQENSISVSNLVLPLFIKAGNNIKNPISSMPGHFQLSVDQLLSEIQEIKKLNIPAVILFGIPEYKDATGSAALDDDGVIQQAVKLIKKIAPEILVITDLCFCEYTDHGHCGVINKIEAASVNERFVDNDQTLNLLQKQAVSHARAGADVVAPSGMMDGMVRAIRQALDENHFQDIPILSYAVKYASSFYGPFREAAEGAPQFGDRKTYQMNSANANEALREAELDVAEGADMLMVKPAQNYLDIIYRIKKEFPGVPLGAYQVSGEFAMIKAAVEKKWVDHDAAMLESLLAIKRAGADFIITYFAKEVACVLSV